ncbi:MAG TPA: acetyltransferase [Burkholderiales bacterium]
MTLYYAFNGDADGLCALQQLRLAEAHQASLVTGVKRDIDLLRRIPGEPGDAVTVLDVSLDHNRHDLLRLLERKVSVRYFDHHRASVPPRHPLLEAYIDEAADVCTSILVDRHIGGRHRAWAVVGAFGDNLPQPALALAREAGLNAQVTGILQSLGICLNYNAYGESIEDLHFPPAELADEILSFGNPVDFAAQTETHAKLQAGYEEDMAKARRAAASQGESAGVIVLPNEPWARRAVGVLINELALDRPKVAFAVLSPKVSGGFTVSVRVPADGPVSASEFCGAFETGGGRKSAGGINHLAETDLDRFVARFEERFVLR